MPTSASALRRTTRLPFPRFHARSGCAPTTARILPGRDTGRAAAGWRGQVPRTVRGVSVFVFLDGFDDSDLGLARECRGRLSRFPELVELSEAGVRLRCGVELKLPDDVVLIFGGAVDHVAWDPEPGPVDRITVESAFQVA